MTAQSAAEQPFSIVLDDDETTVAEGRLRELDAGPTWAKHRVSLKLDDADTSGHAMATAVAVTLTFDDDVEGHALSLHFPTADKADEFRKRLLATGVVAGALVVGVTAAQLAATAPSTSTTPVAAPAPITQSVARPQPVVNPNIPAEELSGATTPKLPASHIVQKSDVTTSVGTESPAIAARGSGATVPKLPSSHAAQQGNDALDNMSPAQRHAAEHK